MNKQYSIKDHLGNVRVTFADVKVPANGLLQDFVLETQSVSTYYPFGWEIEPLSWAFESFKFGFNGQEFSKEITNGNYTAKFWEYDSRIGKRWNIDPKPNTSFSPYLTFANNPVWFSDVLGDTLDISKLTKAGQEWYKLKIQELSSNRLFFAYYNRLMKSETKYFVTLDGTEEKPGFYNPKTKVINANDSNIEVLIQEMFHAYQSDLGVYSLADNSVIEAEGDLLSGSIALSFDIPTLGIVWDQGIYDKYTDDFGDFDKSVLSKDFDKDFTKAVDARINYYKKREIETGIIQPTYTQKNSGVSALALKKVVKEALANEKKLEGPRLPNGDYYSK